MNLLLAGVILTALVMTNSAAAETILDIAKRNKDLDCENAETTYDMSQCAALDQDLTEQGLQATYDELILKLAAERRSEEVTHLVESQSAWLTHRESFCGAVYASFGMGTLRGIMFSSCMSERAEIRREELAQFDWP